MSDLQGKLRRADLSSSQLTDMGGFDPRFVIYLLSLRDDLLTIADHVEPPGDSTPGLLRDDLDGVGDITTAPTSNQAYILDQKTITNTQLISQLNQAVIDHVDETNPHDTSLLDLIDIANTNYIGLGRAVPVVTNDEQGVIIRRLFAEDLLIDDSNIGSGALEQQALNEYFNSQLGQAAWGSISGLLTDQTDLQAALDAKENNLGSPVVDGYVLSSTTSGARAWISQSSGSAWGTITGTLSDQTDLQAALDLKFDKTGGGISGAVSLVDQLQISSAGLDNTTRISFTNTLGNIFGEIESLIGSRDLLITRRDNSAVFTASSLRFKNNGNIETSFNGPPVSDRDITPKSYVDTRAPLGNFSATGDPVNSSDSTLGYSAGSDWINTTTDTGFKCMDATVGAAIWKQITA